ncbi:MAG: phosphatase PAP2 family protein [Nitrospirae bacterium]|nr:phosphatase PAP2 family protein [Nitrospirota bacterium]
MTAWLRSLKQSGSLEFYSPLRPAIKFITHGSPLIIAAVALYIYGRFFNKKIMEIGKTLAIGFVVSGVAVQAAKHLLGRARPRLGESTAFIGPTLDINYDSFPSGHTTTAFCLAYLMSRIFPKYTLLFYGFGILTAFDRLMGISHFPSDIIGGAVLGIGTGILITRKSTYSIDST